MAETSMFFDSTAEDRRRYSSAVFAKFMRLFYSDGVVMNGNDSLMVHKSGSGLSITVDTGSAVVRGYAYFNENTPLSLSATASHSSLPRIDRVILRLDLTLGERNVSAMVLQGTPSSSPAPPPLTRTDNIWDLSLAQLRIPANAVTIQSITDERYDSDVCGVAEGLYTLDASDFQQRAEDILDNLATKSVYSNPNLLLDSHFRLWDIGDAITVSPAAEQYTATLWWITNKSSNKIRVSKHAGGGMSIQFSGGASQTIQISQPIENAEDLNGKSVTLSWSIDGETHMKSYTFQSNVSNSATVDLAGSSGTVVVDWVKLELGTVSTQCVQRPIADEVVAARRYFWQTFEGEKPTGLPGKLTYAFSTDQSGITDVIFPAPVPMYKTPTYTYYSGEEHANEDRVTIYTQNTGYYPSVITGSPFSNNCALGLRMQGHPPNITGFVSFYARFDARMIPVLSNL